MKLNKAHPTVVAFALGLAAACGEAPTDLGGRLEAPTPRQARVTLTPALDVAGLVDTDLARRIVIDEIIVNVSDLRLLGSHPAIPLGGHRLIAKNTVLSSADRATAFPFPSNMLDDDLAVYLRIDPSDDLGDSSVIVRARLFEHAPTGLMSSLTSDPEEDEDESPNPDGEPNRAASPNPDGEPNRGASPNPDGEPNRPDSPNPDGEPNVCDGTVADCVEAQRRNLKALSDSGWTPQRSLSFELRGVDVADLVVGFDTDSRLDVLLGIPASRWFTRSVVNELETALDELGSVHAGDTRHTDPDHRVVVERTVSNEFDDGRADDVKSRGDSAYTLIDEKSGNPTGLRQK